MLQNQASFCHQPLQTRALFNSRLQNAVGDLGTKTDGPVLRTMFAIWFSGVDQASFCLQPSQNPPNSTTPAHEKHVKILVRRLRARTSYQDSRLLLGP